MAVPSCSRSAAPGARPVAGASISGSARTSRPTPRPTSSSTSRRVAISDASGTGHARWPRIALPNGGRMRGLRIAGIVIAVLVALPVLGLALAWLMLDPNEHKDRAEAAFKDATGRELRLEGPLSVSVFPWLAVESGRAAVANAHGFGAEPFASFERARLGVRLWPLLTARRLEFGPVRLDGLALNLLVAKDGRNNWSDVLDRLERR